ncbi:probable inactive protein kinase DDB_G0270444 [Pempheris klunzingeri]|uniref:probable inactive protein kinase DDB_G0270444 n=1 Tax=Pempheris klunzingeri TaxID=3127111 RepID=UPI00397EEAF8
MKTLALLSLSLAVALGAPPFAPDVAQKPVLTEEDRSPLIADLVPVQGHVVVEDPLPQVRIGSKEQEEKQAPVPVDTKQSQTMVEQEVKVRPQVGVEQEGEVKTEDKKEPEVKAEQEVNVKPAMEPESDVKVELDVQEETEPEVKSTVNEEEREVQEEPLVQDGEPIMELEPEVREEPFLRQQIRPEFHVQMDLEAETETGQELEERHIDMERKHEVVAEPIMELEPLDDDDMFREEVSNMELSQEKPLRRRGVL